MVDTQNTGPGSPVRPPPFDVRILRAFKPGDVVFIEVDRHLKYDHLVRIREALLAVVPDLRVIVLDAGMRVVAREETIDTATLHTMPSDERPSSPGHAGQGHQPV